MNVVSIMAHPDDEVHCLGTMLKCRARGDRLFFIVMTDGSKGLIQAPELNSTEAAAVRTQEMQSVAEAAGGQYICLNEPDQFLMDHAELRLKLIDAIRATGAELIFTHFSDDYNLDHSTVNRLVRHCAVQAYLPVVPTQFAPLSTPPALFMCEPFGAVDFPASHYVDITSVRKEKMRLLGLHASQEDAFLAATGMGLTALSARVEEYRGELSGCRWAEGFIPLSARGSIKAYPVLP